MSESSPFEPVGVILAVDPDRFAEVIEAVRRAGLTVTGEQPILGALSGTIPENRIQALKKVVGVVTVDRDRTILLPPHPTPRSSN
ncbi:hypothetical protein ACF09Y_23805 [Streptomyces massasporeus]|uniref:hypothetical protein n=1 Tax=Streptomyces massasporeus TaxID=67324 RepID=UPI0036FD050D